MNILSKQSQNHVLCNFLTAAFIVTWVVWLLPGSIFNIDDILQRHNAKQNVH